MLNRKEFYYFTLILIFISILPYIVSVKAENRTHIKLIIKVSQTDNASTKDDLKKLAKLSRDIEQIANTYSIINQRSYYKKEAKNSFLRYIQSEGYYDATIKTEVSEKEKKIIFYINKGQRYKVKEIFLKHLDSSNSNIKVPNLDDFNLHKGDFAIATEILLLQNFIAKAIEKNNCLLQLKVTHDAIIDRLDHSISIHFIINAGSSAKIKSSRFIGLSSVDSNYAKKLIPFKKGQCFSLALLTETQNLLQENNLFALATSEISAHKEINDDVIIKFNLKEKKHRSLKVGFSYGSDLGFGATNVWHHKNFLGNGEIVKIAVFTNQREKLVDLIFTKSLYKKDYQTLKIGLSLEDFIFKSFNKKKGLAFLGIERKLNNLWATGFSIKYVHNILQGFKNTKDYSFFSTPLFIKFDTKDNFLNPSRGHELQLKTELFYSIKKEGHSFLKNEVMIAKYFPFRLKFDPVLAIRTVAGSIIGLKAMIIPINERFYIGGSGSLRGYNSHLSGKLDKTHSPIGGQSMIENSVELRTKIRNNIGLVFFFDSGNVCSSSKPVFYKRIFCGYGFGVRYFTGFGPLRIDIGFPLKKREKIDKAFHVYFGIGQNF